MEHEQRFLQPSNHPNEVNIIADLSGNFVENVQTQRPGKNDRQYAEPQQEEQKWFLAQKIKQEPSPLPLESFVFHSRNVSKRLPSVL